MYRPSEMGPQPATVGERIRWTIEEHLGITHTEFARRLGIKRPQLSRWINRPEFPPNEASLERVAKLGNVSIAWLRYGAGEPTDTLEAVRREEDERPRTADELAAEDLFRHFEGLVRRMGGANVAPGELRLRKLDVVEGLTRLYAAQGTVPGWVYDLKGRILRDEL